MAVQLRYVFCEGIHPHENAVSANFIVLIRNTGNSIVKYTEYPSANVFSVTKQTTVQIYDKTRRTRMERQ